MKKVFLILLVQILLVSVSAQELPKTLNDSAMALYKNDPNKAIQILELALEQAEDQSDELLLSRSKDNLGIVLRDLGRFEEAKALSQDALTVTDSLINASAYNNIGVINRNLGLYDEALESYLKALSIYEAKRMEKQVATVHNSIGMVYSYNNLSEKAIEYHLKAKASFEKLNDQKGISEVYNNIAIIYANSGDLDEALNYFKYSLSIEETLKDKKGMAESVNNVGAVFYYMNEIDSSLIYFKKSIDIEKSIGNLVGVGSSYNNIAQVLVENDRVDEAKRYIDSAYTYAKQAKSAFDIESSLLTYTDYYELKGDTKTALQYYKEYNKLHDSITNVESNSKIAELEIGFQTEKKEKEILAQRADLAEKELDLSKKNIQLLGLGVLAVILSLLGYIFYNQQRIKNRQLQRENELKDALVKIETQNRLQEQRLRISRDLHDNIGAQLTFIISSLDNLKYGFNLQDKLNDKLKTISAFTTATIYDLRDTIWAMNKTDISVEDLEIRISNFIDKANIAAENVKFNFSTLGLTDPNYKFSSVQGMNIYRIIQEAVNNAIKYAQAESIDVNVASEIDTIVIEIADNGRGFLVDKANAGNGLNNMKKRASDIDADIAIVSEIEKGTTIRLQMKRS